MLFNRLTTKIFLSLTLGLVIFVSALVVYAQPTPTINYQGKLTDSTGLAVADGTYNMRFYLYNAVGVATTSAIWTETLTGTNKVQVTNGLFSVMLGSTTPLTSVDFNQALYLGVEIGGSGSPAWDGEMSPRKPLGTVPAAFESYKLGGVASSSFLRSDEPDTMSSTSASTLLTLIQSGTGDILNLFDGGTEVFTVVDGGNVGIGTSTPNSKLVVSGGTGVSNLLIIADSDNVDENDTATLSFSQDGGLITGSIGFNSDNHLILNQTGVNGGSGLAVNGTVGLLLANSGNVGIGTTTPGTKLTVEGGLQLTGAFKDTTNATGTAGYVLRTTGTSTQWVATSTLGLGNGTFLGLTDTPSSFTANRIPFTNSGATALTDSASLVFDGTNLGIGSTTPTARLTIQGTAGATTSLLQIASSTNATTFSVLASGDVEVPNSFISQGIKWTARTIPETNQWRSITYGNGLFVAVAANGTNQIMTSPDGITWTARTSPVASGWYGVTYGNGLFVAVANSGTNRVMTSPDGITWTARAASEANSWYSVTYGNGLFVAVSGDGTNQVMTSPDGITWTARAEAEANLWQSVTYGNGLFLAVAGSGTNRVMTSPDGITWTARAASEANNWYSVTYGNGLFVAVSQNGTNRVMTSPTGTTWTARSASDVAAWTSVTYGNGLFVAVSDGAGRSMTSPDGLTWTGRTAADVNSYQSVTYGNGLFVAVAFGGANVMTSGKTFTNLLATNNIYQGGMSVLGGAFNIGTTTGTSSSFRNNILNIASTTGLSLFTILADGNVGIGTTTPYTKLTVAGGFGLTGSLYDKNGSAGTNGYILQTTGSGTQWVATSTLGLGNGTFLGLTDTPSSFTANRIPFTNSGATALTDSASLVFDGTNLGIGTSTPNSKLTVVGTAGSNPFTVASSTGSALLTILQNGNVGIGSSTPSQQLTVTTPGTYSGGLMIESSGGTYGPGIRIRNGGDGAREFGIYSTGSSNGPGAGSLEIYDRTAATTRLTIDSAGQLTLGSSVIDEELNIGPSDGSSDTMVRFTHENSNYAMGIDAGVDPKPFVIESRDTNRVLLSLLQNGNASVGTTSPWAKFTVQGTYGSTTALFDIASSTNSAGSATTSLFRVNVDGKIGIGTNNPDYKLTISSDETNTGIGATIRLNEEGVGSESSGGIIFTRDSTAPDRKVGFINFAAVGAIEAYSDAADVDAGNFRFSTDGPGGSGYSEVMRLTSSGNVGIGTTTPGTKLTIAGSLQVTGAFKDSSNASGTAGYVLQTTGTSTIWVATSSLGISGGSSFSNSAQLAALLSDETGTGLAVFSNSPTFDTQITTPSITSTTTLAIDSNTTSALSFGTGANAKTITLGNVTGATAVNINTGTGGSAITTTNGTLGLITGTGAINIGADAAAKTITIGNVTGATLLTLDSGTSGINIGTKVTSDKTITIGSVAGASQLTLDSGTSGINIGTKVTSDKTITIGSTGGSSPLVLNAGTGGITIGTNAAAQTITLGNSTGATSLVLNSGTGAINVGTNAIAHTVTLGNVTGATAVNINTGTGGSAITTTNGTLGLITGTGAINIGADAAAKTITIGNSTGATGLVFNSGTGHSVFSNGNVGIGTTTPGTKLTIAGGLQLTGAFKDSLAATGTAGYVLQTTGTSTRWVATSTLGITGGASTFLSLTDTPSSFTANRIPYTNSGATALIDSASLTFDGSTLYASGTINIARNQDYQINGQMMLGWREGPYWGDFANLFVGKGEDTSTLDTASATGNVGVGGYTLRDLTTGGGNTAVGFSALGEATSTSNNTAVGYFAGSQTARDGNSYFGSSAGYSNRDGEGNSLFGAGVGYYLNGGENVIMGHDTFWGGTGDAPFDASNNVVIGSRAGINATTSANNNILLGYQAADNLTSGANNIVIGYDVDLLTPTSTNKLNIGNLIFGTGIDGTGTTLSSGNIGIGTSTPNSKLTVAGDINLDGYYGLSIDSRRVFIASSTINSILIGEGAGDSLTSGYTNGNNDNIFIGYQAGQNKAAGWDWANNGNIFVGYLTGKDANGAGSQNILFGQETGYAMSGDNNSFIGFQAGYDSSGDNNNFMGQMAGYTNSGGGNNYFGYNAATLIDAGDDNIAIGTAALRGGSGDPWATSSNAARNIALGYQAGYSANGGNNNILIGHDTANNLTSGDNNIVIGYDIDLLSATQSNTLNIGNLIFGNNINGTSTTLSTGNIGIGTTTPGTKLTVAGSLQVTGAFKDSSNASGTAGYVLQSTGSGTQWVATSSLGITGGASSYLTLGNGFLATATTTDALRAAYFTATSTTATSTFAGALLGYKGISSPGTSTAGFYNEIFGLGARSDSAVGWNTILGYGAYAVEEGNVVIGTLATSTRARSVVIGQESISDGYENTVIGYNNNALDYSNVIVGVSNTIDANAFGGIAIGSGNNIGASGVGAMAIGWGMGTDIANQFVYGGRDRASTTPSLLLVGSTNQYTGQDLFKIGTDWIESTDATRKGRATFTVFDTAEREFMRADSTGSGVNTSFLGGNVAVGTSTPSAKFNIQGTYGSTTALFDIASSTNSSGSATSSLFRVNSTGNVGIGTTTPAQKLTVSGTIQATNLLGGAVNLTTDANGNIIRDPSDVRLKENIQTIGGSLDKLLQLRGVSYQWIDKERFGEQTEIGFIAQELDEVLPEVVRKGGDYWSVNTRNIIAVVVEAVKEIYARLVTNEAKVQDLENRVLYLESLIEQQSAGAGGSASGGGGSTPPPEEPIIEETPPAPTPPPEEPIIEETPPAPTPPPEEPIIEETPPAPTPPPEEPAPESP